MAQRNNKVVNGDLAVVDFDYIERLLRPAKNHQIASACITKDEFYFGRRPRNDEDPAGLEGQLTLPEYSSLRGLPMKKQK